MNNRYWKSLDERDDPGYIGTAGDEFVGGLASSSRRDFLRLAGFGAAGAVAASCAPAPVRHEVPYVAQPDGVVPGRALYYATTCGGCSAGCGLVVKSRDGRPIKIEGCPDHPVSAGGICGVGQATLLGVYDSLRFRDPQLRAAPTSWATVDAEMAARLAAIRREGGAVRVLTNTVHSPTARRLIDRFLGGFRDAAHVEYDAISASAILDAHQATHGVRVLPRYRFDRADVIVSFDADFLGTWISPSEFTAGWAKHRRAEAGAPAWHAQIESRVSISGGKADRRIALAPDEIDALVFDVADVIVNGRPGSGTAVRLASRLLAAKGRSLVVSGRQGLGTQILVNRINDALGSYGATLDVERPSLQRRGDDGAVARLLDDAAADRIAALFVWHANPLFDLPGADALRRVPLVVSFAERPDETTPVAHVICPDHHQLESWGDSEPVRGTFGLTQPLVNPLGRTRAFVESIAAWSGEVKSARELVRDTWRGQMFTRDTGATNFETFWDAAVERGHLRIEGDRSAKAPLSRSAKAIALPQRARVADDVWLTLYYKPAILAGEHAYNPLLQELADPISKVVWDNYACIAPSLAARLNIATGDVVRIDAAGASIEIPALVQPGQQERTISVALGYGSVMTERFKTLGHHWFESRPTVGEDGRVGVSATAFLRYEDGLLRGEIAGITLARTGRTYRLACTQDHHTLIVPERLAPAGGERRDIVKEIAVSQVAAAGPEASEPPADLWPVDHPATGHRWGMVIDLDACTGCSACIVGCQVENNTPVVGKDEVGRSREMHWLRIDRYYSEDEAGVHTAMQPMLCQQCGHAPCETVCPTLATVHSAEGLNQQVYNRCVGTRYCLNNCPYKARRFNWFAYSREPGTEHLMLNPDVTVRSRGVMEKCTFCVQRIQDAKVEALRRGVPLADGDIRTACEQSCPAQAITFGDLNDPKSRVAKAARLARGYRVLEELNVQPSVTYLKVVRREAVEALRSERRG